MQSNQKDYEVQINLKGFFRVIIHRKWIFIITAIIIFAICMVYTFIFSPEYSSSSQIKISDDDIYYNNDIYRYFPDEASSLWILKDYHRVDTAVEKLYSINSELKSDSLLNEIITKTAINISPSMLYRSIDIYIDRGIGTLTITTYLKSGESAYKVNKALLETYINLKKTALENAYNDLLNKVESRLVEINSDMESLDRKSVV